MIDIIRLLCPYPSIDTATNNKIDGMIFLQPNVCKKCEQICCTFGNIQDKIVHHICPEGVSVVVMQFIYGTLVCNGLIVKVLNQKVGQQLRKQLQEQKIFYKDIENWYKRISENLPKLEEVSEKKAKELIDGMHNVKAAVSIVTRNAEAIIHTLNGNNSDDKIENADPSLKALLKSVELLNTRLSMTSIMSNPDAAKFGRRRPWAIHKLFYKMKRLFDELANGKHVTIRLSGQSHNQPRCYDSIESIALVLLDNAVKYSQENQYINIIINDTNAGNVSVEVESTGFIVPDEMKQNIFCKGVRTESARKVASSGSGLGLYIAQIIAEVHGFTIIYKSTTSMRDGRIGKNIFYFEIPNHA